MATGSRSTSRGGARISKPRAHKRRRGIAGRNVGVTVRGGTSRDAVAHERERYRHRRLRSRVDRNSSAARNRKRTNNKRNTTQRNGSKSSEVLPPIQVRSSGIMIAWKKTLGGLIRYYVYKRMNGPLGVDQKTAEEEVDRMYYKCRCSVEDTKMAILEALGVKNDTDEWVDLSMAIENGESIASIPTNFIDDRMGEEMHISYPRSEAPYKKAVDGKGILLNQLLRPGEGPAHSREQWTTIIVPQWAVGKSYYFQVKNNSPLDLSCELFLDGEQVAFNAPVAANSTRTIRPDGVRYFQRHQWMLNDAKRVKLGSFRNSQSTNSTSQTQQLAQVTPRYNGLRPDYADQRISIEQYPDPTAFGWKFTGSVQQSRVEFFEKKMNDGGIVKLDFYYTTGTVKTVLDHPAIGRNQLFRAQVAPEEYRASLENPRMHTGKGYRRMEDRPAGGCNTNKEGVYHDNDDDDDFDGVPTKQMDNEKMDTGDVDNGGHEVSAHATYYARDNNYDFKTQGHQNRRDYMNKLQQSSDYMEWKEANKKEYAVIHAKFYVSVPKRTYRSQSKPGNGGQRKGKQMETLPVPEQATFVDIKAAENCTLGTKYHTTGPLQVLGRSNVRMERINGLTDDKACKGDPVFEKKLFYRAENVINGEGLDDDFDDEMSEDEENQVNNPDLLLAEYKTEKIEQVMQYHSDLNSYVADDEEAEQLLRNVKNKIYLSECTTDVDESVNLFYSDLIRRQFDSYRNNEMSC